MKPLFSHARMRLLRAVELFFKKYHISGRPVLLGFSGGHDSRALFELLCKSLSRRKPGFKLVVAHVDHGWRLESKKEAQDLKVIVEERGIPFYLHTLSPSISEEGNLEDRCREERYRFFQMIYDQLDCQALILAHQADDQAETVLKRLFEGAHFTALGSMTPLSTWGKMHVWRPLLEFHKEEIMEFLEQQGVRALDDQTNYDPSFLRARMRIRLLPMLESVFGKNFRSNLLEFAKSFQDLRAYFVEKSSSYIQESKRLERGFSLDFSKFSYLSSVEVEVTLKLLFQEEGIAIGTRHLKQLAGHLITNAANKSLYLQKYSIHIDKKKISVLMNLE